MNRAHGRAINKTKMLFLFSRKLTQIEISAEWCTVNRRFLFLIYTTAHTKSPRIAW